METKHNFGPFTRQSCRFVNIYNEEALIGQSPERLYLWSFAAEPHADDAVRQTIEQQVAHALLEAEVEVLGVKIGVTIRLDRDRIEPCLAVSRIRKPKLMSTVS